MLLRWQAPQPWRSGLGPTVAMAVDPYVNGYVNPYVNVYARDLRTPYRLDGGIAAGEAPRGASRPQKPRPTSPPRGRGAAAPSGCASRD